VNALSEGLKDGRIGRFPVWAVGVMLAGGILAFMWWRNRSAGAPQDNAASDEPLVYDTVGVDGLPPGAIGDYLDSDPTNPAYPTGLTPTGIPGPITNVQWSRLAFDYLIGQGNDPALVERALAKYISGNALTQAEQAVVNLAQRAFGAPPEGLIIVPQAPATPAVPTNPPVVPGTGPIPKPTTGAAKTERRSVIVARFTTKAPPWNSYLAGIAGHYGTTVAKLISINKLSSRPKSKDGSPIIYTGERIWIDP